MPTGISVPVAASAPMTRRTADPGPACARTTRRAGAATAAAGRTADSSPACARTTRRAGTARTRCAADTCPPNTRGTSGTAAAGSPRTTAVSSAWACSTADTGAARRGACSGSGAATVSTAASIAVPRATASAATTSATTTTAALREGDAHIRDKLNGADNGRGKQDQREHHDAGSRRTDQAGHRSTPNSSGRAPTSLGGLTVALIGRPSQ